MRKKFALGPSAGFVKTEAQARECLASAATIITLGSYTWEERDENPTPNYVNTANGSLNSLGLPNRSVYSLRDWIVPFLREAAKLGKHVRISIAAFSPAEYARCAKYLRSMIPRQYWLTCCSLELNLGCPNVWGESGQKPIASLNPQLMREVLEATRNALNDDDVELAVKVSPFVDFMMFAPAWSACMRSLVTTIVTMNTFPNAFGFDDEGRPLISGAGFAGLAGNAVKLMALGQVAQWSNQRDLYGDRGPWKNIGGNAHMRLDVHIDGVGGVSNARDVIDMRRVGANSVLVGTAFGEEGNKIFQDIAAGLPDDVLALAA